MKSIIIYASTHHGNTRKVAERMAKKIGAKTVDLLAEDPPDISEYKLVGLLSGVYFGKMHEAIVEFAREAPFTPDHRVFLADTCGAGYKDYTYQVRQPLEGRGITFLNRFQCPGYDTYGPFKYIGGIRRDRPNEHDLKMAEQFVQRMQKLAK